jgi:formylglycine-generating enzyme required for sulfatase activity
MWSPQNSHVGRGGGWNTEARYCRSAYRNGVLVETGSNSAIGFRVALTWP